MKKKGLIALYTLLSVFIVGIIATVVVIAVTNKKVNTDISMLYVSEDIEGTVSATYKVGENEEKAMTDNDGNLVVSFDADQPSTVALLSPKEAIALNKGEDLILTYTFTSTGEEYYARVSYSDTDLPAENISTTYENRLVGYDDQSSLVEVPENGSITYSIKISVENLSRDASLEGTFDWTLTREEPETLENSQLLMYYANNGGSSINADSFIYKLNDDKTKFKIVGAVPENIATTTTTTGYVNGSYNTRTAMSDTSGDFLTVEQLTNNNGAEFYYFCTNPAVVGSYSYNTPGTIYWTSTADDTLENWYDIPDGSTTLYACFMTPNYTGRILSSAGSVIISNKVSTVKQTIYDNYASSVQNAVIPQSVTSMDYAFYRCNNLASITIPNSVTSIGGDAFYYCYNLTSITIPSNVTSIGEGVFCGCTGLTSITIPDSVTSIGSGAFYNCTSLTSITIENGVTSIGSSAFWGCTGLTEITIPDSVTSIGSSAFYNCTSLTSITIPDSVTSIDSYAFYRCASLTNISIPNSVTSIGELAFCECIGLASITIPNSVTSIGFRAFDGCTGLTEITIPDSVTSIGSSAFWGCTGLTEITIPDSVTSIGSYAFYGCTSLTSIIIPDSVTSIGSYAFVGCTGLTEITIPDGVTSIGDDAFYRCTSLTSISIPNSVTSIGDGAFEYCTSLASITIPSNVTSIGSHTFYNCTSLTSITIPNSVTSIGDHAFRYCTSLASITIPDSVTSIGSYTFYNCTSLTSIIIPDSVTSIGDGAFEYCTSLASITIPSNVTSIGSSAFYNCTSLTSVTFEDTTSTWKIAKYGSTIKLSDYSPTDTSTNATYLKSTYYSYTWTKNS